MFIFFLGGLVSKDQGGGGNRIFKGWKIRTRAAKCKQTNKKLHSSSSFLEGYRGMFFLPMTMWKQEMLSK